MYFNGPPPSVACCCVPQASARMALQRRGAGAFTSATERLYAEGRAQRRERERRNEEARQRELVDPEATFRPKVRPEEEKTSEETEGEPLALARELGAARCPHQSGDRMSIPARIRHWDITLGAGLTPHCVVVEGCALARRAHAMAWPFLFRHLAARF